MESLGIALFPLPPFTPLPVVSSPIFSASVSRPIKSATRSVSGLFLSQNGSFGKQVNRWMDRESESQRARESARAQWSEAEADIGMERMRVRLHKPASCSS